jgi:hypothetical protein
VYAYIVFDIVVDIEVLTLIYVYEYIDTFFTSAGTQPVRVR